MKDWFESKTIWGALVAASAALAGVFGVVIDGTLQQEVTEIVLQLTSATGALIAIYGRLSARDIIA